MIQKISKNGVGLVLLVLALLGLEVEEKLADDIVAAVTLLVSVGLLIWNQIARHDVAKFFIRR